MWEGIEIGIKIITLLFELLKLPTLKMVFAP